MKLRRKQWLPLAVLFAAGLGALGLVLTAPSVETVDLPRAIPTVRVIRVEAQDRRLAVHSQGTVAPRTESVLIPEVSGRVDWVSPQLVSGGFFSEGDVLLRLDRRDHESAVVRARANLSRAEGEVEYARRDLGRRADLAERNVTSGADLDDSRRSARVREAELLEARAQLDDARRDLERTELRAPFSGRVREEKIDVGQFVNQGSNIATLYATDYVEVRLPVPDAELAFLDLPLWSPVVSDTDSPPAGMDQPVVVLSATFAGRPQQWSGRIVRTEGEIDAKSRMVNVVARVERPYERSPDDAADRPPLAVGLFVHAEISGAVAQQVLEVPRSSLRSGDQLVLVDAEGRLRLRPAELIRTEGDSALVRATLAPGERVCVSSLDIVLDGMEVAPLEVPIEEALAATGAS